MSRKKIEKSLQLLLKQQISPYSKYDFIFDAYGIVGEIPQGVDMPALNRSPAWSD